MVGPFERFKIRSRNKELEDFLPKIKHMALNPEYPLGCFRDAGLPVHSFISEFKMAFKVLLRRLCPCKVLCYHTSNCKQPNVILKDQDYKRMSKVGIDGLPIQDTVF